MTQCHIDGACTLLQDYLAKFDLSPEFSRDDFEYFFMPREDVIHSYVATVSLYYVNFLF